MLSVLELSALESSLEIELAEVMAVGLVHLLVSVKVEESCTAEVYPVWVINDEVDDLLLETAAATCHLICEV
jgi:hypothetical protein